MGVKIAMNVFRLTPLRQFCAVADAGSITLAARALRVGQPALTRSIRRVERDFGEPLFRRTTHGVELTGFGEAMLPYARAILAEADRATEDWRYLRGQRGTRVKLGLTPNFVDAIVPETLRDTLAGDAGKLRIQLVTGNQEQLVAMLNSAQLDLALILSWKGVLAPYAGKVGGVLSEELAPAAVAAYAPAGHRLARERAVPLATLQDERWAIPHNLAITYIFQGVFTGNGLRSPAQTVNTTSLELLVSSCIDLGLLTVAPRHVMARHVAAGTMTPLDCKALELDYRVFLLLRAAVARTQAVGRIAGSLRARVRTLARARRP